MTKEISKQALEAGLESDNPYIRQLAANALRNTLEQPVQEPVQEPAHGDIRALKHRIHELEGELIGYKKIIADLEAERELVQKPVACRFCHSKKGCWAWQCYECGEIDDVQKPTPPATQPVQEPVAQELEEYDAGLLSNYGGGNVEWWQDYIRVELGRAYDHYQSQTITPPLPVQEPLEYWNAVEGWVKIDEVREHFEAVNCGTIYKHGGDGRVPLYTAPPQRPWVGLTEDEIQELRLKSFDAIATNHEIYRAIEAKLKEKNYD
jgi:hypothetical protein